MRTVTIKSLKRDKKWIESNLIDVQFIENYITSLLNQIRPCKNKVSHKLKLAVVDSEFSYYDFSDTLFIAKKIAGFKSNKQKARIIEDLFHEFCHFVQYKIDKVPICKFAIDHEDVSYTSYFKNKTEVQARAFSRLSKECVDSYAKIRKIKRHLIKLS